MTENSIIVNETGDSLEYRHPIKRDKHKWEWMKYFANELGRLEQEVGDIVKGTKIIF